MSAITARRLETRIQAGWVAGSYLSQYRLVRSLERLGRKVPHPQEPGNKGPSTSCPRQLKTWRARRA